MPDRLPSPWLLPVSVEPSHFVNRAKDVARLKSVLRDRITYDIRSSLIVVRGDRGIGKSIFVRRVLDDLASEFPHKLIPVVVDHRGSDPKQIARDMIRKFVAAANKVVDDAPGAPALRASWLDPLNTLAYSGDRVVRAVTAGSGREYGASAELGADLWTVLHAKFQSSWKERVEQSQRVESALDITVDVLRTAMAAALQAISVRYTVVMFFDDIDQAQEMDNPETAKSTVRAVLDIAPCIAVLHLRSEVAGFADWRREVDLTVRLDGLDRDGLVLILRSRADAMSGPHRLILEADGAWEPLYELASRTDNPYVLLRWAVALAESSPSWPPSKAWASDASLRRLAVDALNGPSPDDSLLRRLGQILDLFDRQSGLTDDDLLRGHPVLNPTESARGLTRSEIDWLKRFELLVAVDRFDPSAGLRLDPLLALIRPRGVRA